MDMKGNDIMYCCAFLRDELLEEFKTELELPSECFLAVLKIDNNKYSYLIDGITEKKCSYEVIQKYLKKLRS